MNCKAKNSGYNHKKTVANLTPEQKSENLEWAMSGYRDAIKGNLVTCRGCKINFKLALLYRCWFCGSYFCSKCSKQHFGSRK